MSKTQLKPGDVWTWIRDTTVSDLHSSEAHWARMSAELGVQFGPPTVSYWADGFSNDKRIIERAQVMA